MKPKKDLNYIAKLEQAIAKKYGEGAIQNPEKYWDKEKEEKYLKQLQESSAEEEHILQYEEKIDVGGFFIPKKLINREVKRICPVCKTYSFKAEDDIYMNKYECCFKCFVHYVEHREERWLKGWRPQNAQEKE
jgi:phage FluMu gp28-like protein|tara:strand:+ start:1066 stop:1464 length:399 start_codon:yes stop_codon:yes gene_type:complete